MVPVPGTDFTGLAATNVWHREKLAFTNTVLTAVGYGAAPTTANVYEHGCIYVNLSSTTGSSAAYENVGTAAAPSWRVVNGSYIPTISQTIATTGNTDFYMIVPFAGSLVSVDFSGIDALAANDTNYITFSITNLGQAGAGSTAMLAATDVNTTKATGGTGIGADTKRSLTLHGTAANLVVAAGDRLRIRAAVTNTLANTVTGSMLLARFA